MTDSRDTGFTLDPRYDSAGLITAVATDRVSGDVLMVAHMNAEALAKTIAMAKRISGRAAAPRCGRRAKHRATSLAVAELRIDCDQDSIWLIVDPTGPACHTGERSCFYRRIEGGRWPPRDEAHSVSIAGADVVDDLLGRRQPAGRHRHRYAARSRDGGDCGGRHRGSQRHRITGLYARDTDRVCIVPDRLDFRIGAFADYGVQQTCSASGTVTRVGNRCTCASAPRLGAISTRASKATGSFFPGRLPDACAKLCERRASLAALDVERLSESVSEATTLRDAKGKLLCATGG